MADQVAVVGLGYVGLPLAIEFGKKLPTIGFDLSERKVAAYRKGYDPTGEVEKEAFFHVLRNGYDRFKERKVAANGERGKLVCFFAGIRRGKASAGGERELLKNEIIGVGKIFSGHSYSKIMHVIKAVDIKKGHRFSIAVAGFIS